MIRSTLPRSGTAARLRAAAFCLATLTALPAAAQQDLRLDDWSFNLFNDSGTPIDSFQTADKTGLFGHNWLSEPMLPGIGLTLEFTDPLDRRCTVPTRIVLTNGAAIEAEVSYCGTAILRLTDTGFVWE
jgi:hypothetical protein